MANLDAYPQVVASKDARGPTGEFKTVDEYHYMHR